MLLRLHNQTLGLKIHIFPHTTEKHSESSLNRFRITSTYSRHILTLTTTTIAIMDPQSLQPQQLVEIRKRIDQEISHFTQSLQALQTAQTKLRECCTSIDSLEKSTSKELLVPLTSSLYLPGETVKKNEYLVDIGTGYFVEKSASDAKKVYDFKIEKLNEDGKKLKEILVKKNEELNGVNLVLREKMIEYEKQEAANNQ